MNSIKNRNNTIDISRTKNDDDLDALFSDLNKL